MWLGSLASGYLKEYFTDATTKNVDWVGFWTVPAAGVLVSFALFVLFFRDRVKPTSAPTGNQPGQEWVSSEGQLPQEGITR